MNKKEFIEEIQKMGICLNSNQLNQLEKYYSLLIEWNQKINLTAITLEEEVYLKHFYDSISLFKIINLNQQMDLCDIGTGAGFPGIVLKIVFPKLKVTLVDSLNKRIKFLNLVIEELDLKDIETVHARAEEFSKENEEKYDIVTARAVSHLSNLLEYTAKLIKLNGYFIAMKSNVDSELSESQMACTILNLKLEEKIEFELPKEKSKRVLLKYGKYNKTPSKYPRKYSEIKKKRL